MSVYSFGSINIDTTFFVPHLPAPGETLTATGLKRGLGGKGANQSAAAAKAGSDVRHVGTVGPDGAEIVSILQGFGVQTQDVAALEGPTGQATIYVDDAGENAIVVYAGANKKQSLTRAKAVLSDAKPGGVLLLQNEVNKKRGVAEFAQKMGLRVVYSCAPFSVADARNLMPFCDILVVNEVEVAQLCAALGVEIKDIPVPQLIVTYGKNGVFWRDQVSGEELRQAAFEVEAVDTTGAGDCFIGYVAGALDQGMTIAEALRLGSAASALQVTRPGTASAIPGREEVDAFLRQNP